MSRSEWIIVIFALSFLLMAMVLALISLSCGGGC